MQTELMCSGADTWFRNPRAAIAALGGAQVGVSGKALNG